jgi:hypothetical protein
MPSGRVCEPLNISSEERHKLESWVRRPKTAQRLALRARIVLRCPSGMLNQDVARELRLDVHTIVFISHDRTLLRKIATPVLEI